MGLVSSKGFLLALDSERTGREADVTLRRGQERTRDLGDPFFDGTGDWASLHQPPLEAYGMHMDQTHRVIEPSVLYVGTPVYLVGTKNPDGSTNLAPASSHFALGRVIVLGLEDLGQSLDNVLRHPELTVNFPEADQWKHVERLAAVTGKDPVPEEKVEDYTFEPRKFELAELTPESSDLIDVSRVAEAPIQLECRVIRVTPAATGGFAMVEAEVLRVHALNEITVADTNHLNPHAWHPLIYSYRHFFDRGEEMGWTRKSPLASEPPRIS